MIAFDSETCGFVGPAVLLQYRQNREGPIVLHEVWKEPITKTLKLLEWLCTDTILGFNLTFDWFHVNKLYNHWRVVYDKFGDLIPETNIRGIAELERYARDNALCLKPVSACDLMLVARKGPFQSLMDRKPIRIRKIPTLLSYKLKKELEARVELDDIYFSGKKDRWHILDTDDKEFKDLSLTFRASGKLKVLHSYIFPDKERLSYSDISVPDWAQPEEKKYRPFTVLAKDEWPDKISYHIRHWNENQVARRYAELDVSHLEDLYGSKVFNSPEPGDDDSILACSVAACRVKGYRVNLEAIEVERAKANKRRATIPQAPREVKKYLFEVLSPDEQKILKSTSKETLKAIAAWKDHPAAERAQQVINARTATKEIELFDKLLSVGRFHSSFIIIGALSGRMSGSDDLNPQGIKKTKEVRSCFPLADEILLGGDFDQFEVAIAEKVYGDPELSNALKAGKKIHALMAVEMYPEYTYEQIMETKGTENDLYGKGKNGVFSKIYGGDWTTLVRKYNVEEETAKRADERWNAKYKVMTAKREKIASTFQAMKQPLGLGSKIHWNQPAEYIESYLGFRRYFTLEYRIVKALYDLANNIPKEWRKIPVKVQRRDREQQIGGAVQSAIFAAAFAVQGKCMRAAINHIVQSPGAAKTKNLQRRIWDLQPIGVSKFLVQPMNIHDEIMCPVVPEIEEIVLKHVEKIIGEYRDEIPLVKFEMTRLNTWADK